MLSYSRVQNHKRKRHHPARMVLSKNKLVELRCGVWDFWTNLRKKNKSVFIQFGFAVSTPLLPGSGKRVVGSSFYFICFACTCRVLCAGYTRIFVFFAKSTMLSAPGFPGMTLLCRTRRRGGSGVERQCNLEQTNVSIDRLRRM